MNKKNKRSKSKGRKKTKSFNEVEEIYKKGKLAST